VQALDLYAGAGGWSLACTQSGIDDVGVEFAESARATRSSAGFKNYEINDVWDVPYRELAGSFEGLIASPPCQTYSVAGSGAGRRALEEVKSWVRDRTYRDISKMRRLVELHRVLDDRTALVLIPLHAVWVMRPQWVAWEQVPGVLPVWEVAAEEMRSLGYDVWTGNLQSEQYGVAQTRRRAVLIGRLRSSRPVAPPAPTHSKYHQRDPGRRDPGVPRWMSMADAIGWGFTSRPSYTYCGVSAHAIGDVEWGGASVRRALQVARASGDPAIWAPDPTDPSVSTAPRDFVRITVDDAAVLQSFPRNFPWAGSANKWKYLQIGNAIPPLLAGAVLRSAVRA